MGYLTDFSGSIIFRGLKETDIKKLKNILHNHGSGISDQFEVKIEDEGIRIEVWSSWKNYEEEMEKVVTALVRAYPKIAMGRIDATGEERDDTWAIEIGEGRVKRIRFEMVEAGEDLLFDACLKKTGGTQCLKK